MAQTFDVCKYPPSIGEAIFFCVYYVNASYIRIFLTNKQAYMYVYNLLYNSLLMYRYSKVG